MKRYFALLDGEPGAYGVAFPGCAGCMAIGADENEAYLNYLNAVDALGEWTHDARLTGTPRSHARSRPLRSYPNVRTAMGDGAIFLSVPLVIEDGRAVKANISLDRGLLDAIDAAARRNGLTRSGFLASAEREKIAAAKGRQGRRDDRRTSAFTRTDRQGPLEVAVSRRGNRDGNLRLRGRADRNFCRRRSPCRPERLPVVLVP